MAGDRARYLLDTHALIWWWQSDPSLSPKARAVMADRENEILVSAVSGIEIAIKVRKGKLPRMADVLPIYGDAVLDDGFAHLAVNHDQAIRAGLLKGEHRDPFDRLIAAQALTARATVITRDRAFAAFGCDVLW